MRKNEEIISLDLSKDEALVFFDLLSRYSNTDQLSIEDQAEARVLWDLCCLLEKQLVEPFHKDYAELLKCARAKIRDQNVEETG